MDNITHSLLGLTLAKTGLERLSPWATTVCVLAANAPDIDVLTRFKGPWYSMQHHRGITHSIVGTLALAVLLPLVFYGAERLLARLCNFAPRIRLPGLLLVALIACATHPLLDWTNNYGVRPFLPWSGRWYYGDLVFILDPWLWLVLGAAAFLLTGRTRGRVLAWGALALVLTAAVVVLPALVNISLPLGARVLWVLGLCVVGYAHRARLAARWGPQLALGALAAVVLYWGALAVVHARALTQTRATAQVLAQTRGEAVLRVAAMPMLADPTNWLAVAETDRATYRFQTQLLAAAAPRTVAGADFVRYEKPQGAAAAQVARAATDERAEVFLGFARFPVVQLQPDCISTTLVQFADLRYSEPGHTRGTGRGFTLEVEVERP